MLNIPYIGTVKSKFNEATNPGIMREAESEIIIFDEFAEGLFKTEMSEYLEIYFHFDKAEPFHLKTFTYTGDFKGVFATRSPRRPSKLGSTIVKLLERNGNKLKVQGLDALNDTPVIDIKPLHIPMTEEALDEAEVQGRKVSPRKLVLSNIWAGRTERLMLDAAQIHGHFCPGLAMGVMMATKAMQMIRGNSDGLEDLLAIVETNNCISDGIQFVTGCTFGNNALIFKDFGKVAFTLTKRDGKGVRISACANAKTYMKSAHPLFSDSYKKVVTEQNHSEEEISRFKKMGLEKAFATLSLDFDKLFSIEEIDVEVPDYAPSH
ncbi:MAG: TrmO family methyltransferase, partial [Bacteroidales bacterium]|nr:TrmO family methyltransferase [Bacteroidales bacterium]